MHVWGKHRITIGFHVYADDKNRRQRPENHRHIPVGLESFGKPRMPVSTRNPSAYNPMPATLTSRRQKINKRCACQTLSGHVPAPALATTQSYADDTTIDISWIYVDGCTIDISLPRGAPWVLPAGCLHRRHNRRHTSTHGTTWELCRG